MSSSKFRDRSVIVVAVLLVLAGILIGCGGGGSSSGGSSTGSGSGTASTGSGGGTTGTTSGSIAFTLKWPTATRDIPSYAKSLVLSVANVSTNLTQTQTVNRSTNIAYTQTVTFSGLSAGTYTISGKAYLDPNATGPVVATFTAQVDVISGSSINAPISFNSTIAEVVIDGVPAMMETGITSELSGYAVDSLGDILLLPVGSLQWSVTQGSDLVELTTAGFISAIAPGIVTVRLTDSASGQFDEETFEVTGDALTTGSTTGTSTSDTGTTDATTTGATTGGDTTTGTTTGTTDGTTTGGDTTGGDTGGNTGTTGGTTGGPGGGTDGIG